MRATSLLRLYPRAWRERYGDEFLALVGDSPISTQQTIDIVFGAVDAHLSGEARQRPATVGVGGGQMLQLLKMGCRRQAAPFTTRDALFGAAAVLLGSIAVVLVGRYLQRLGYGELGESVMAMAVPAAVMFSMPFTLFKGQPWRAQAAFIGGILAILGSIAIIATLI